MLPTVLYKIYLSAPTLVYNNLILYYYNVEILIYLFIIVYLDNGYLIPSYIMYVHQIS